MSSIKVVVNLADAHYDVAIGTHLLRGLGAYLRTLNSSQRALIITDSQVGPLYLTQAKESLHEAGYKLTEITIPAGESSKTIACAQEIWEAMAQGGFQRDSLIIALGGGVVGDLAGFVASTYMRGIDFVQVPTSLLAMVDSSVGGKTAVNLQAGKNLVGSFKQPLYVCASTDLLTSLSENDWACGCAEIVKSALLDSDEFFFWLSDCVDKLASREEATVIEAIARSVVFKASVVGQDTFENKQIRECLNYGHTLGHAIEALAGYGRFSHGQAVAEGMRFAAGLGKALCNTSEDLIEAQDELLNSLGLKALDWAADPELVIEAMLKDKKSRQGGIRFVLLSDVGDWELKEIDIPLLNEHLALWQASKST